MSHEINFNKSIVEQKYPASDEDDITAIATAAANDDSNDTRMTKIDRAATEYFTAPIKVEFFVEHGEPPFNEQVQDILLDCDDMGVNPPYRTILDWIKLTGKEDVPAPEVVIPEEWDEYKGIMSLR